MHTYRVILPIDAAALRVIREQPDIAKAVEYAGGAGTLAYLCLCCQEDWDSFFYDIVEQLHYMLETMDENPKHEQYNRIMVERTMISSHFKLFLLNFFETHQEMYSRIIGKDVLRDFPDITPRNWRRENAIAVLLSQ